MSPVKIPPLGKMIGPLPLGGWVAVTGGGVGLAVLANRRRPEPAPATAAVVTADDATGAPSYTPGVYTSPIPGGAIGLPDAGTPAQPVSVAPPPATNDEWARSALIQLVGRGFGAYAAQAALGAYLEGRQLTAEQAAIVEGALRYAGPPPYLPVTAPAPLPAQPVISPTVPAPPPAEQVAPKPPPPPPPAPEPGELVATNTCPPFPSEIREKMNPGETIIGVLHAPNGGCWYASNYGGVFALGGAPFYGSARPYNVGPPVERRITTIVRNDKAPRGYMLISQWGEQYRFG